MEVKLNEVADIKFCLVSESKEVLANKVKWLTTANLLEGNKINGIIFEDRYKFDESILVKSNDIIIKRISPTFVNFIDYIDDEVYAYNNLILIKVKDNICPQYLAYVLNKNIKRLASVTTGTAMPSVGRSELENLNIPVLSYDKQVSVGEIWHKGLKLNLLRQRLSELENIKLNYDIEMYMKNQTGGRKDGR